MKSKKGLIYTVIARNRTILVEETNRSSQMIHSGNFIQIVHILLPKLPTEGNHVYYYDKNYSISILNTNQIMILALSHKSMDLHIVYSFLHEVANEFINIFGNVLYTAQPFSFSSFASSLNILMNRFNNGNASKTKQVLNQMNDIKDVMINNIDMILQRGEKLDLIIDKTADLAESATLFRADARRIKTKTLLNQWKLYGIIGFIILLIATIIIIPIINTQKKTYNVSSNKQMS